MAEKNYPIEVFHHVFFRLQAALGSGFSLQAAFWYQNAMLAQQEKPEVLPVAGIMQKEISIFFRTRPEIPPFCTLDSVVATIVAMKI